MSERKWTPGPWAVRDARGIRGANGECVASTYCAAPAEDAHLIAAAPDMYEALDYQVRNCPMCKGSAMAISFEDLVTQEHPEKTDCSRCASGRATLAKARGEA